MSSHWKKVLIKPEQTIRDALFNINQESLRTVLVVNKDNNLIGMVTDGDIRRGLLNNLSLEDSVTSVMNSNPITADNNLSKKDLVKLMEKNSILSVPIIKDGVVIGLETLQHALTKSKKDNPVFLMAGGFGTRLRPLTNNCPKPMLKIGNKPLLETVIDSFIKAGFHNFFISTHYMPEKIEDHFGDGSKWDINIQYIHEKTPLGTGGALGLLPNTLPNLPIIMMNGDILTKVDFERILDFHNKEKSYATMCVREHEYQVPYGVINGEGASIQSMEEKPVQRFFINAGIYVIDPEIITFIKKNQLIDMPTLLEQKIHEKKKVLMFPLHEYWLDIGRIDDFKQAQVDIISLEMGS